MSIHGTSEIEPGARRYQDYWATQLENSTFAQMLRAESEKKAIWLALVDARHAAGLTQREVANRLGVSQAQVARIEKRGYESHTVATLRRYVRSLGEGFDIELKIRHPEPATSTPADA